MYLLSPQCGREAMKEGSGLGIQKRHNGSGGEWRG
jgi:hypothetical protein